jgi:hypothetical protein
MVADGRGGVACSNLTVFVDDNLQMVKLLNSLGDEVRPVSKLQTLRLGWHYDEDEELEPPVMAEGSLLGLTELYLHVDVSDPDGRPLLSSGCCCLQGGYASVLWTLAEQLSCVLSRWGAGRCL